MKRKLLLLFLLITISLFAEWVDVNESSELFEANSTRSLDTTTISFMLDGYNLESVEENGIEFSKISHENEGRIIQEGMPDLPRFTRLVAIPDQGEISYKILNSNSETVQDINVYPRQALIAENGDYDRSFKINNKYYKSGDIFPSNQVEVGTPAIMRDHRIVAVTINPFRYNPQSKELEIITDISVEINVNGRGGENSITSHRKPSRSFQNLYKSSILNYDAIKLNRDAEYQIPSYLFIYPNNSDLEEYLTQLVEWKHQKGFEVHTLNTSETGNSNTAIKAYIQDAYDNWENPPEYICLIGDAEGTFNIPYWSESWSGYSGGGDHHYTQLEGDDILADASIGRISISSLMEFQTIINKIFYYEKTPYTDSNWFEKAVLVGDPSHSGQTTIDVNQEIGDMILNYNSNFELDETYSGNWANGIISGVNNGASYLNYRGYIGMSGFDVSDIANLNNGPQLPYAIILTCATGTYYAGTSRTEAFLRVGTPSNPKGAIGSIGVATSGTHTCFNNSVTYGIYHGVFNDDIFRMGDALLRGKLNLYEAYPDNPENKVDIFSYWINLMGDPGLDLWTRNPENMQVEYNSNIAVGTNYLEVNVTDENGLAIEDAWVSAVMGEDEIFQTAYTDENGNVLLEINADTEGEIILTVTKPNYIAHSGTINVSTETSFVNVNSFSVDDSNGNNDGYANPGETFNIELTLENLGSTSESDVVVEVSSENEYLTINSTEVDFGNIPAGGTATAIVNASLAANTPVNYDIEVDFDIAGNWTDMILLPVTGINIIFNSIYTDFEVGQITSFPIVLENIGTIDAESIEATLESANDFINVTDNSGFYNLILAGDTASNASNTYTVQVNNIVLPGTQHEMILHLENAEGFQQDVNFFIEVGEVSVTDPLGPDAGGYVCYDMNDINYYQAPEYDWIEINDIGTEINVSDNGNQGAISVIDLPFTFTFYGEEYNQITVCTNGWITPGVTESRNYMNWPIPGPGGPSPMIAPFWDDLMSSGGGLYYYYDSSNNYFVVEWDNYKNQYQQSSSETFQVILYDEMAYPTVSGNSNFKFQYKEFNNVDAGSYGGGVSHGAYATIGIESLDGNTGIGYSYYNQYPTAAMPLSNETAIFFTESPVMLEQPYLVISEVNLANETNILSENENVEFDVLLSNLGENQATGVSAELISNDPYITINNGESDYNDISNSILAVNNTPFEITVGDNVPDNYSASFTLVVETDLNTFELHFSLAIGKPDIQYKSIAIYDEDNGMLDPGETAHIVVSFENIGLIPLENSIIELSENDANLTINNSVFEAGTIPGLSIVTGIFNVTVSENAPIGLAIPVVANISGADDYNNECEFSVVIGLMVESFESGDFNSFDWQFTGSANWNISNEASDGEYSAHSGTITDNQQTGMELALNIPNNGSITFDYKVSSEGNYDFLRFYIDGSEQDSWSGNQNWETVTYDVNAGNRTFKWEYTKDGSVSSNSDCAWVDNIIFPGGSSVADIAFIQGNIELETGDADVADVTLQFGENVAHPNEDGSFNMPVIPSINNLVITLDGYLSQTIENIELEAGDIYSEDFTLVEISTLGVPTNLTVTVQGSSAILNWNAPASRNFDIGIDEKTGEVITVTRNLIGYRIYRDGYAVIDVASSETSYTDQGLPGGVYEYYVTALYSEGESLPSNIVTTEQSDADDYIPMVTALNGNYPNPFNPTTTISFDLANSSDVKLEVYNIKGQKIVTLVNDNYIAGKHSVTWNGKDASNRNVASGVYFYKMSTNDYAEIKKMMLLK